ncbi:alpha/beta fold hydrolase [Rhodoferax sp.]|uniref:alpha/beta fold hydrolase n=1 Tax=Rhodoferax sp. TaxID=50421 RepID=UPI00271851B2|nr:alpha/beta hydrolase [Rhodoferax sp.]MDO9197196.1 alpha/beta hydrolase [Rhodoferax sp.]
MKIRANGIDIEIEDSASINPQDADLQSRPTVLLIMGLGMQLIAWPPALVQALVDAGYRVIRHDNRDVGLSQHFDHLGVPNLVWAGLQHKLGFTPRPPYSLGDMAFDALGVLDALKIARAHIVGVSMGGMIAQRVALMAPQRTLSLTSIMSTSGAKGLPPPRPEVVRALLKRPADHRPQAVVDHYVKLFKVIGSPAFPTPEAELRERILKGAERGFYPVGTMRQMLAIMADITRAAQLARVRAPTLVVHGKADPLVPYACGEDTARRIAGAKMLGIEGMGHDLPPGVVDHLLAALLPHLKSADPRDPD